MSLQPLLRQPYSRDAFRSILEDILPSGTLQLRQIPQVVVASCDFVTGTVQTGSIELPDGNTIALLEVEVSDQVKLARNRVALRNFVARFIDEASTTAVLAVFHQPGKADWRLTYACKRSQIDDDTLEITSTQTAPRRYTFLLGNNEPCRTAAGRLAELREKGDHLTLDEVEKAFSVERLNKDFFKDYKKHYEGFVAHLLSPDAAKTTRSAFGIDPHGDEDAQTKADKPVRDFVKRLLGRFVFLHFLQKKGWMGCKAGGKAWTGGDGDFLASYFALAESKGEADRFHSRWLIPLFFEALNNAERPGDLFDPTGTRIPYLNGGLFDTDPAPLHALDFPAGHFRALLDFFGQYHFTIDENDPEDHEVGIDPEMLGHIFENLLEDNKDKGAYYTPKAIVSYMARQSLLHYLQTHLGGDPEIALLLNEKDLTRLEKNGFVHQHAARIAELLDEVKICDPAIGSGAFPIGLLQEILWTRLTLNWELNTSEERARLKRRNIQNSIHGVDLDPGAVEIARLRFWLALVVDEDQPRPLPNLDYKIHRADSLIEYIRGEPVHLGKVSAEDKRTHGAIQSLVAAKAALFSAQKLPEKRAARFALYRALADVAMAEFTWLRNDMGLIADDAERAAQLDLGLKEFGHRLKLIDGAAKQSAGIQDRILGELREWFDDEKKPTFLWQLHFGEVFARGGFDIVIANPPYISVERFANTSTQEEWRKRFKTFASRADIYCFFYERSIDMLRDCGALTFITSNKFQRAGYGEPLRRLLVAQSIQTLIDFCELPVFAAATDPMIVVLTKAPPNPQHQIEVLVVKAQSEIFHLPNILALRSSNYAPTDLTEQSWTLQGTVGVNLLKKLRSRGTELSKVVGGAIMAGIKTGFNKAFWLTETEALAYKHQCPIAFKSFVKPLLLGDDARRWKSKLTHTHIIYTPRGTNEADLGELGQHLKQWKERLERRALDQKWFELQQAQLRYSNTYQRPKIVYPDIALEPRFAMDLDGRYPDMTAFSIPSGDWALLAMLNSSAAWYFLSRTAAVLGDADDRGRVRCKTQYVSHIPIPPATPTDKARLSQLAEACAAAAQRGDDASLAVHEAEIDEIVYRLFDLTPDEIALIESALAPTRQSKPARARKTKTARLPAAAEETPVETRPAAKPAEPWLPGELFNVEGELPPAKKAKAASEAASVTASKSRRSDSPDKNDLVALLREILAREGACDRATLIQRCARSLGYQRTSQSLARELDNAIRTANRRGILYAKAGELYLDRSPLDQWDRAFLKDQFLAAINQHGRVWLGRVETVRLFTRWFGYRRTGPIIAAVTKSLTSSLLRERRLEKDSEDRLRRVLREN